MKIDLAFISQNIQPEQDGKEVGLLTSLASSGKDEMCPQHRKTTAGFCLWYTL